MQIAGAFGLRLSFWRKRMNVLKCKPWGEGQGDHVLVNEEDFNPDFHVLLDAPAEKAKPGRKPAKPEQSKDAPAE